MIERAYLDWNATAPLRAEARAAVAAAQEVCGNPSSVHAEGRAARRLVEDARDKVAALVGAEPRNVVFTSGGTEANVLALSPRTGGNSGCGRLLVSAIEHPSVLAGGQFSAGAVEKLPVCADGRIDLARLAERLGVLTADGVRPLVSVLLANNETGVIQPIWEVARLVHEAGGLLHVDAVQACGRIPCDINDIQADLLTVSAHKIGGPKGVGALIKRAETIRLGAVITGGGQERGARAGTENVAAIAGFGAVAAAARMAVRNDCVEMQRLRDGLEARLTAVTPNAVVFGAGVERLPNTTLFSVPGMKAETAIIAFDLAGVAVSSGAACSSGKVQPSHVLAAQGVAPALARGAVRVSLGPTTTESDVNRFLDAWIKVSGALLNQNKSQDIAA
ncbi:MAG: cysteine desulfurase [Alphaproteobacteria bacterium]|jgi:cysteine desulfurase|nr:cysteine desulfurase [Alphaproteobacteria bacterium]